MKLDHMASGQSSQLYTLWRHQKLLKGQVVSQRLHSSATYKYSYPVGVRNTQLYVRGCGLYTCIYIGVALHACIIWNIINVHAVYMH